MRRPVAFLRGGSLFRFVVVVLLIVIATLQFLILQRVSVPVVTLQTLNETKDPSEQDALRKAIPLVRVSGTVEVEGSVDIDNVYSEVDVNVSNEPLQVSNW